MRQIFDIVSKTLRQERWPSVENETIVEPGFSVYN